ncbi:hypothetical protein L3Q72_15385 [Vibrio sp. JC009]|uniref:hypothetical protein n=1 Tax=Vibrio sp. JC009 TaxID=2912314 RepID=UPI0023B0DF39|nr:hypothetical protein [Vibrio sp. JC009]WED24264.1 hypothetical protein L3Q72_15385 [Vibrio sp. JC009]
MFLNKQTNEESITLKNVSDKYLTEAARKNWLSYWKHFNRSEYQQCAGADCTEDHHHGVLVKHGSDASKLFVVPVCEKCSSADLAQLSIDSKVDVISAELSL